jgi:DNA-binding LytR/AlgR family response regulator
MSDGDALIRMPLKELLDELDPSCFWPIHRSTIVNANANANAIASVARDFRGRVFVKLKSRTEKLTVSETHEHLFKQM